MSQDANRRSVKAVVCFRCGNWPCECKDGQTIIHGDCREVLPGLGRFDLVLTDPPYGIGEKWHGGVDSRHGWAKAKEESHLRNEWDASGPSQELLDAVIAKAKTAIVWGGNYFLLPVSRCWLVWNKPERGFTLAEAELAWTNVDNVVRVCDWKRSDRGRQHPTQKPIEVFKWCLQLSWAKRCVTVLDPFMGSGTTLRAAKDLGRRGIGIELEERYCEIAANRLKQEVLF